MKQQILKLCKRLNRFTIYDLVSMAEIEEDEVTAILEELRNENIIKEYGGEYIYVPQPKKAELPALINKENSRKKNTLKTSILFDISAHFPNTKEKEIFENAPDWAKPYLIKYTTVLRACGNLRGNELIKFLEEFNKQHPEYKISYNTLCRLRQKYLKNGLKGLIPAYNTESKSVVPQELYNEFKILYLGPNHYSVRQCVDIIAVNKNYDTMPSGGCFMRLLKKEYSENTIEKLRSIPLELPALVQNKDKTEKITQSDTFKTEKFITGAELYLKAIKNKKTETEICRCGYVKNHLIPYFKTYKFKDITQDVINNYVNTYLAKGYSMGSINRFLAVLSIIMNTFADINNVENYEGRNVMPVTDILTKEETQKIIKNYTPDLWYFALGIKPAELAALSYEDIDYNTGTVKINKVMQQGIVQKYRTAYQQRKLRIPRILLHKIPISKGTIFYNINSDNYDKILNTHIKLLIYRNVQINIIAKNLGFRTTTDFEKRYNFLLPQNLDEEFEIL